MHLLISLFQSLKHGAAVSDSPYFFFHQRGRELESFLFIEFSPRVHTPALSKQLHITPSPSTNSCLSPLQICSLQNAHSLCTAQYVFSLLLFLIRSVTNNFGLYVFYFRFYLTEHVKTIFKIINIEKLGYSDQHFQHDSHKCFHSLSKACV